MVCGSNGTLLGHRLTRDQFELRLRQYLFASLWLVVVCFCLKRVILAAKRFRTRTLQNVSIVFCAVCCFVECWIFVGLRKLLKYCKIVVIIIKCYKLSQDGYRIKIKKITNCNEKNVITIDSNFTTEISSDCMLWNTGCYTSLGFSTAKVYRDLY